MRLREEEGLTLFMVCITWKTNLDYSEHVAMGKARKYKVVRGGGVLRFKRVFNVFRGRG